MVKTVYSFDSVTPIMCFNLFNNTDASTLIAELQVILQEAWDACKNELVTEWGDKYTPPDMGIRVNLPWIPGVKQSAVDYEVALARKIVHFEMDIKVVPLVKILVARAKALGLVAAKWGIKALLTEADIPLTRGDKESVVNAIRKHTFLCRT